MTTTTTTTTATATADDRRVAIDASKLAAVKRLTPPGMSLEEHLSAILMRYIAQVEK